MTNIRDPKMASTQRRVLSDQRCSGPDSFDMWHDYMNLSKLLVSPQHLPEPEMVRWDTQKRRATPGPTRARGDSTSSLSSLSDNSQNGGSSDFCHFCKQNGETARVYRSHKLKAGDGRVVCPILWSYTCPICEATGDQAHTRKYCPVLRGPDARAMQH
ncbi:nanos homolog 2 [Eucyclogobius newberryi]|uniref:nanos homolog 2 n=1 Tax=Eucyclogobius newberryi TaxID=166745 RepID=UPI003B5C0597